VTHFRPNNHARWDGTGAREQSLAVIDITNERLEASAWMMVSLAKSKTAESLAGCFEDNAEPFTLIRA
jgi:hypothetical protein